MRKINCRNKRFQKIIIGLGNPGEKFKKSRHNIGFLICDEILRKFDNFESEIKFFGQIYKLNNKKYFKNKEFLIIKPLTYMNESGKCVKEIINNYPITLNNLLIIHDDIDLNFGRIKFKFGGGSAGHKGVESIIDKLNDDNFCRLRFGISRPPEGIDPVDYVLQDFMNKELRLIKEGMKNIVKAILDYIKFDIKFVMEKYN
jgi:PTH1 family peptidyl-tRNA hydrolase